jgi:hypothetical protein
MTKGKKMREIERMLRRKRGVTAKELRVVLGWPSISIPQRARQLRIKTRRRTETRYWAV